MKKLCLFVLLITGLSVASFAATTNSKTNTKEIKAINKKAVVKEISSSNKQISKKSLDQKSSLKRVYVMWAPCGFAMIETGTDKELSPSGYMAIYAAMWMMCYE